MTPACWLARRALTAARAREVDAPDSASRHARRCPGCRTYAEDLRRIEDALPAACSVPIASGMFTERTLAALPLRGPRARRAAGPARVLWIASAALALTVLVSRPWRLPEGAQDTSMGDAPAPQRIASIGGQALRATPVKPSVRKASRAATRKAAAVNRRRPVVPSGYTRVRRRVLRMATGSGAPRRAAARSNATNTDYAQWAAWFEGTGDHIRAAAAYAEAYRQSQDPDLAYRAGRNLEQEGRVANALEYYLKAMEPASQGADQPQKGSLQWNGDQGAA